MWRCENNDLLLVPLLTEDFFAKESSVSDQHAPTLGLEVVSSKWSNGRDDTIDIPHLGIWVLNGNMVTYLKR